MGAPAARPQGRDYLRLFGAMNTVLNVLATEGDAQAALRASFESAAAGFGAFNALLLVVGRDDPARLSCIHGVGSLTPKQIDACERGESVKGVSPSVIRQVIETRRVSWLPDPRLHAEASRTSSLEGANFSVLCAPILDPLEERVLAVLYFQSLGVADAFVESDVAWLEGYSAAVGRAFGFHFGRELRERELRELLQEKRPENAPDLVGESSQTMLLRRQLHETYIPIVEMERPDPILVLGERGTGKDLVARYLHAYSSRSNARLVVVNCAELTDELAAARLFGHKRGAFTGALTDEAGCFRAAHGGVLFLDEIGDLSLRAQAVLLRVLENHVVVPVGETREIPVDVAVILATNRDLGQAAKEQALRMDFYDRFRTQAIRIAPLRERPWDVAPLIEHFRAHHERRARKRTLGFTQDVVRAMVSHGWPGNVRELARSCSLLVAHAKPGARIDRELVARCCPDILGAAPNAEAGPQLSDQLPMREAVRALQRELILSRLERCESVKAARESLGLDKATFYRYVRALRIPTPRGAGADATASSASLPPAGTRPRRRAP